MADDEQIRLWRQQLAEEVDSDEDLAGGIRPGQASHGRRRQAAPPAPLPPSLLPHSTAGVRGVGGGVGSNQRELVLQHKMQLLQLQLEEREIELQEARRRASAVGGRSAGGGRGGGGGGGGSTGGTSPPGEMRDAKLKDLAKRSKAATMALGRERAQNAQLASELATVKRQLKEATAGGAPSSAGGSGDSCTGGTGGGGGSADEGAVSTEATIRELRETKEKLAAANTRLHRENMAHQAVKAELQRCQRALAKEVGDETAAAKLLEDGSGAKGRAQQIALLREQLREARAKLSAAAVGVDGSAGTDGAAESKPEDRQRSALQTMELERRGEMERLLLREQLLEAELNKAREKGEAQAARIKNLEGDLRSKKEKLKAMLDKSETDDELVAALREELNKQRSRASGSQGANGASTTVERGSGADSEAERRLQELSSRLSQQQTQIDRQEQIIVALRDQLEGAATQEERLSTDNTKLRELVALLQEKLGEVR